MSTLKAGKFQHPDAANSSIEFDASGNITKFVGPSGGADGNVLTKSGTAPAWTSAGAVGGLVLITTETFTTSSTVSLNGCFTSTYQNYLLVYYLTTSTDAIISYRHRASAADISLTNYQTLQMTVQTSAAPTWNAPLASNAGNVIQIASLNTSGVSLSAGTINVFQPMMSADTSVTSFSTYRTSNNGGISQCASVYKANTAIDGFSLIPSTGTITGNIRVYGYRNA